VSLKPPKKSDMNKAWMTARRDRAIKIQPETHLIVTEGTQTEPAYFGAIADRINSQYRNKVHLEIYGGGVNTLSLFEKARKRVAGNPNGYRHVWVVYDTDDFPPAHVDQTAELCTATSNEETQYHAIWSNQCIELWFLLHFGYMQSDLHRREYWSKLTQGLKSLGAGEYRKNYPGLYELLYPLLDFAIANAKRLEKQNAGRTPSQSKPGTKVFQLLEKLKPYLKEETT